MDFLQYQESAKAIQDRLNGFVPKIAMVLGSGLGGLGDLVENPIYVDYKDVPHFKPSTAPGHKGRFVFGTLEGRPVAVMQGRMHHYEGYSYEEVTCAVRVLRLLGCETLIVTNAAGCVRTDWNAGELMLITDQLKLQSESPLRGENLPPPICTPPGSRRWRGKTQKNWACCSGRAFISIATAPSTRRRRRSVRSGSWAATRWVCPPPRRSSWPPTAAWRCWA